MITQTLAERLAAIQAGIAAAATASGRSPADIRLIGVSKTHPASSIAELAALGIHDLGENRVQEADAKRAELDATHPALRWHLIGHLQTNKARKAALLFDMIHSVDSLRLAEALNRHAAERPAPLPVLLQVNVSGEASKDGFALAHWQHTSAIAEPFVAEVAQIAALPHLRIHGLMTIAPYTDEPGAARATFHSTRLLRDTLAAQVPHAGWHELSMGMTDDYADAIAEGATFIRIGRALFGERPRNMG